MKILLMVLLLLGAGQVFSEEKRNPEQLMKELEALEAEIAKFREMLKITQGERSELESSLKTNEIEINQTLKRIEVIQADLKKGDDKLSSLSGEQQQLNEKKVSQQQQIAMQIRAAYEMGQQPYLKALLNQQDPQKLERMMSYFSYITDARQAEISEYEETITQLANLSQLITEQNQILLDQRMQLSLAQRFLLRAREEKTEVLVLLNQEIRSTGNQLERRLADREQLDELLNRITAGIANLAAQTDTRPFVEMRGNLFLPVVGQVSKKFGSTRLDGKLRWNGVVIEANEGDPVHAVHYGRVVFSEWLRGFGLLMIVSHGDGYMSLYGHNQVLYRETGDWVAAGEAIASVGNTGGQSGYGLYFEIRAGGKPFDPQLWCQARTNSRAA